MDYNNVDIHVTERVHRSDYWIRTGVNHDGH